MVCAFIFGVGPHSNNSCHSEPAAQSESCCSCNSCCQLSKRDEKELLAFFKMSLWTCFKASKFVWLCCWLFTVPWGRQGPVFTNTQQTPIPLLLNICYLGNILLPQMCLSGVVTDHIKACPGTNQKNLTAECSASWSSGSWRDSTLTQVWDIATYCGVTSVIKNRQSQFVFFHVHQGISAVIYPGEFQGLINDVEKQSW